MRKRYSDAMIQYIIAMVFPMTLPYGSTSWTVQKNIVLLNYGVAKKSGDHRLPGKQQINPEFSSRTNDQVQITF